jgi:hypothetical protein
VYMVFNSEYEGQYPRHYSSLDSDSEIRIGHAVYICDAERLLITNVHICINLVE